MKDYSGDNALFPLQPGYASSPDPSGIPIQPPIGEYQQGALPLTTLPAPYWNWFIGHLTDNSVLSGSAFNDIYTELKNVLAAAGITPDSAQSNQLLNAIMQIITTQAITPLTDQITQLTNRLILTENKVPSAANDSSNQLADKAFVNSSIINMAARYITPDTASLQQWPSIDALRAGPWYHAGQSVTPSQNDYAIFVNTDASTWRAIFSDIWSPQYKINDTPFTAAQLNAINSGITTAIVSKVTTPSTVVTSGSSDLVTSGAVYTAINNLSGSGGDLGTAKTDITNLKAWVAKLYSYVNLSKPGGMPADSTTSMFASAINITGTWTAPD